jgi:hypothetical protein
MGGFRAPSLPAGVGVVNRGHGDGGSLSMAAPARRGVAPAFFGWAMHRVLDAVGTPHHDRDHAAGSTPPSPARPQVFSANLTRSLERMVEQDK